MAKIDDRVFFQVSRLDRLMTNHLKELLVKAGLPVTMAQSGVLFLLAHKNGRRLGELAGSLGLDNSALTRLADRLEKGGLVERREEDQDRRAKLLYITAQGRAVAKKAGAVINRANREMLKGVPPEELEHFFMVMNRLCARCGLGVLPPAETD